MASTSPQGQRLIGIQLFDLPSSVEASRLAGTTAIAIDVLRASTSIITAISEGAESILPCETIEEAEQHAAEHSEALLGGERHGVLIEGFDLGNSPSSYTRSIVGRRIIIFTSTNGTRAIAACQKAEQTLIGAFVNLASVCDRIIESGRSVSLVCAGTNGVASADDLLLAGAICEQLTQQAALNLAPATRWNPPARAAWQMWRAAQRQIEKGRSLAQILAETQGGKNIVPLGLMDDIEFASNINHLQIVPKLDRTTGRLVSDVDLAARHG